MGDAGPDGCSGSVGKPGGGQLDGDGPRELRQQAQGVLAAGTAFDQRTQLRELEQDPDRAGELKVGGVALLGADDPLSM